MKKQIYNYKRSINSVLIILILILTVGCGGGGGGTSDVVGASGSNATTLSWNAPTTNADGTALTDLAGYKVYYGTSSGNYSLSVDIGNITGTVISSLESGNWCFAVTAYDTSGNESAYSAETCKTI